jgi:hypothetical protein
VGVLGYQTGSMVFSFLETFFNWNVSYVFFYSHIARISEIRYTAFGGVYLETFDDKFRNVG